MSNLNNNTTQLEALLAKVNALPDAGGADTSDATAAANEIFAGKTAYISNGKVTGTFTIENELTEQNDLIAQISTLVATKANPQSGEDVTAETNAYTAKLASLETAVAALESELEGKASGGSGGGSISTCTVEIHMSSGKKCQATTIDANGNIIFSEVTSVFDDTSASGGIAVIENVVCNSFIYCDANLNGIQITGTATIFKYSSKDYWTLFKSPSVANEHCIISW